jgi:uncharacterized damage-inducible protein DinB
MSQAEELATRFEQANQSFIETVQAIPDSQWQAARTAAEGWSVNVAAHHIAQGHEPLAGMVQSIATTGQVPAYTTEMVNQGNAEHAQQFASVSKAETIEALRTGAQKAAAVVRTLSDEQLDRTAKMTLMGGTEMSARQVIENVLIGHIGMHRQGIDAALGK